MTITVLLHDKADKEVRRLDAPTQDCIKKELKELETNPEKGKHLEHGPFWSLRIGDYRAIYAYHATNKQIIILWAGHREHVYADFRKLME